MLAGLALGAVALLRPRGFQGTARAELANRSAPRYWLNVVPQGGIDAVWTTDPKTAREVKAGVDVPYRPNEIVDVGRVRLGPHFKQLAPLASAFSIVNGVLVRTANHHTGIEQTTRLRTHTTMRTPAVFEIIGAHRDSQPLAHVCVNSPLRQAHTSSFFGSASAEGDFGGGPDVLQLIGELEPTQLRELATILDGRVRSLKRQGPLSEQQARVADNINQVRAFFERVADVPKFESPTALTLDPKSDEGQIGPVLDRALWLIENDLAAAVTVFLGKVGAWDSHVFNEKKQSELNPRFAASLSGLFQSLETRTNRHGKLSDQTGIVIGSEIGRFPYVNANKGKDHYPQVPVIVAGPPFVVGAQFGRTGKELESRPVASADGRQVGSGDRVVLDDIGHTVLRLAGLNPKTYAVPGRYLQFLASGG